MTLNTGLRKSEIFNLKWKDIRLTTKQLIVYSGKGDKDRVVVLNDAAINILMKRRKNNPIGNIRVFDEIKSMRIIDIAWGKIRIATKIKARFHDLRSTYASYSAMNGMNPFILMKQLGHSSLEMVLKYTEISEEERIRSANIVQFPAVI